MKQCTGKKGCGETKPLSEFSNHHKHGKQSQCKACMARYQRERRARVNPTYTCRNCKKRYKGRSGWSATTCCSSACAKGNLKQQDWHVGELRRQQRAATESKTKKAREARAREKSRQEADMRIMGDAGFWLCRGCGCLPLDSFTPSGIKHKRCAECNRSRSSEQHRKNPDRLWLRKQKRRLEKSSDAGSVSKQVPAAQRTKVLEAANWICYYCGIKTTKPVRDKNNKGYTPTEAHVDHIVPIKEGGTNETSNLRCSCGGCNLSKGAKIFPAPENCRPSSTF